MKALQDILFPIKYELGFYEKLVTKQNQGVVSMLGFQNEDLVSLATARVKKASKWTKLLCCKRQTVITGYIMTIGIDPKYRRQGLGTLVLKKILFELFKLGCKSVLLHVKSDNTPAINFYKKHGFIMVAQKDSFYFIDEKYHDAYEMLFLFPENSGIIAEDDLDPFMKPSSKDLALDMIVSQGPGRKENNFLISAFICLVVLLLVVGSFIYVNNNFLPIYPIALFWFIFFPPTQSNWL